MEKAHVILPRQIATWNLARLREYRDAVFGPQSAVALSPEETKSFLEMLFAAEQRARRNA
jgi:hypothetical protein